jgi:pectate lyase
MLPILEEMDMRVPAMCFIVTFAAVALFRPLPVRSGDSYRCSPRTDSIPSSLGADGWAATRGPVTGGCGAVPPRVYIATSRSELVAALNGRTSAKENDAPKIIYVEGTIDLNVDDGNVPLTEEDYMRMCGYADHATYYDPDTRDQTGPGGFFGAYKAAYDPNLWIRQSLDPADNRPLALFGPLEDARTCFAAKQYERVVVLVGSNTSIIGKPGTGARIVNGTLKVGRLMTKVVPDPADPTKTLTVLDRKKSFTAKNVVIRNITFADAFDMFPGWDPKDSFSITLTNTNGCQAIYDAATDSGPHRCTYKGGRWNSEYDTVVVENGEQVWIDHNTFTDEPRFDKLFPPVFAAPFSEATQKVQHHDGQVDVVLSSTRVTISNNHFRDHDKTNLLAGQDIASALIGYGPGRIDVTFHHNYWQNTGQRMPRVRFGRVHTYNNVLDLDMTSTASYKLGDSWIAGTAAKLFAENNLFDIRNTSAVAASKIANYSSTNDNKLVCIAAGFTEAECGTYFYDAGTVVTTITATATTSAVLDIFAALKIRQESNVNNAPLFRLDPALPDVFWLPSQSYSYSLVSVGTPEEQAALREGVKANAGAGTL